MCVSSLKNSRVVIEIVTLIKEMVADAKVASRNASSVGKAKITKGMPKKA